MVAGDESQPVDALVLGGGPGGYVAAIRAAQCGRSVTLVEGGRLGGVCLNEGCVPSKALAELAGLRRRAAAMSVAGLRAGDPGVDLAAFQAWKAGMVERLSRGVGQLLERNGVHVLRGWARFAGRTRVGVQQGGAGGPAQPGRWPGGGIPPSETGEESTRYLDFKDVVIATGSTPLPLPGLPFDGRRICHPGQALDWTELPAQLVVVGGDPVGLELASAFALLGSEVTLVEPADRLLPAMDPDLSRAAQDGARSAGVRLLLRSRPHGADEAGVALETPDGEVRLPADRLLVSAGREPCLADLDLPAARLRRPAGALTVDDQLRVERHVFAIGDVTAGPPLAHRASAQGRVVGEVLGGRPSGMDAVVVPEVVFAEPALASAGLTAAGAAEAGADVGTCRFPLGALGRGVISQAGRGWVKLVFDRDGGRVLGVQLAGGAAAELVGAAVVAIEMGATLADMALTIQAHPTFAEALTEAAELGLGRPVHTVGGSHT